MPRKCPKCGYVTPQRSIPENNYYWGVVIELLAETTGFSPEEAHQAMKLKFLRIVKGKIESVRSTTDLTVAEFETYLEKIRMFASQELSCWIPLPNQDENTFN